MLHLIVRTRVFLHWAKVAQDNILEFLKPFTPYSIFRTLHHFLLIIQIFKYVPKNIFYISIVLKILW